jgi:hypothetical protein
MARFVPPEMSPVLMIVVPLTLDAMMPANAATYADVIHYLIKGDGADIGSAIAGKFGNEAGALFEVALKSNLLILLYQPGDDQGIGEVIKSRMSEIGLPANLWMGVVTAIGKQAPENDVKDAVFKMHDEVAAILDSRPSSKKRSNRLDSSHGDHTIHAARFGDWRCLDRRRRRDAHGVQRTDRRD